MITLLSSLCSLADCLEESIASQQKIIAGYPEGRLVSYMENDKYIRYKILIPGKKPVNVSKKDKHTLIKMARKRYFEEQLQQQEQDLIQARLLINDLKFEPPPFAAFHDDPGITEITRKYGLFEPSDDWSRADYPRNPGHPETLKFMTPAGYPVRSKSEYIIITILIELGIPFRYEAEFLLDDGRIIYPDFTLKHPRTERIFIVEHFGLMGNHEYKYNAWDKIRLYDRHGYRQDDNLICFFEYPDTPLNPMYVRDKFKNLVLN